MGFPNRPRILPCTAPFWDGVREHRFLAPRCRKCGELFFPPRPLCPRCLSRETEWTPLKGRGRLYAFTRPHVPPHGFERGYVLGLVDLEEGLRVFSQVLAPWESLRIGIEVRMVFREVGDGFTLYLFEPVKE